MHARRFRFRRPDFLDVGFDFRVNCEVLRAEARAHGRRQSESAADTGQSASPSGDRTAASGLKGIHMTSIVKKTAAGAVLGGSLMFAGMGVAQAAPPVNLQDGLVNVGVGNVTIAKDVNVGVAAQIIAAVCGTDVTAAVLGDVDQTGTPQTFCNLPGGPLTVTQNAGTSPGNSGNAPGNNR